MHASRCLRSSRCWYPSRCEQKSLLSVSVMYSSGRRSSTMRTASASIRACRAHQCSHRLAEKRFIAPSCGKEVHRTVLCQVSVFPLNLPEVFHFLLFQEVIHAAKMLNHPLVGEFVNLAHKAVQKVAVMGNHYKGAVKVFQRLF